MCPGLRNKPLTVTLGPGGCPTPPSMEEGRCGRLDILSVRAAGAQEGLGRRESRETGQWIPTGNKQRWEVENMLPMQGMRGLAGPEQAPNAACWGSRCVGVSSAPRVPTCPLTPAPRIACARRRPAAGRACPACLPRLGFHCTARQPSPPQPSSPSPSPALSGPAGLVPCAPGRVVSSLKSHLLRPHPASGGE
jgi:hypothetical protein